MAALLAAVAVGAVAWALLERGARHASERAHAATAARLTDAEARLAESCAVCRAVRSERVVVAPYVVRVGSVGRDHSVN